MTDLFTQEIKDLMKLATTDFNKFYEETKKQSKSSGDYSTAASSGDSSIAASSGDSSIAASSGDSSTAASSGYYSKTTSSGKYSKAASSGDSSKAASSGDYSIAASSGYYSTAASSGKYSKAASSGDYSTAASSGDYSIAASSGEYSACSALGYRSAVKGDLGNLIMASEYAWKDGELISVGGKADIVDGKKLKPNQWYIVENGEWAAADYTDGVFSFLISSRGGVKKVKTEIGEILFVVTDGEYSAHGKTAKLAREALLFKTANRDTSAYKDMTMDTVKTPTEWAVAYHVITGACQAGCKNFLESNGKLKPKYTLAEIIEKTKEAYGSERFIKFVEKQNDTTR